MKKIRSIFLFGCLLILALACNKREINELKKNLSLEQAKVFMLQQANQNILISSIDSTESQVVFTYENASTIAIEKSYLRTILVNKENWNTQLKLSDNTLLSLSSTGTLNLTDSIVMNPYGTAPLCAVATVKMPIKGKFSITVKGKPNGGIAITKYFAAYDYAHILPVLGLYENYLNQVQFNFFSESGTLRATQTVNLQTPEVPNKPTLNISINKLSADDASLYYAAASGSLSSILPMAFDQRGEIRWYYTGDLFELFGKLTNGNLIANSKQNLRFYHSPSLNEISMLGQLVRNYVVPNYQHHDVWEMPSGNLLVATNSVPVDFNNSAQSREDLVIEMDRSTGNIVQSFNFNTILDPSRTALPSAAEPADWIHINRAMYVAADSTLLISSRSQCAIVKLKYPSGEIKWILGAPQFWNSQLSQYLLTPVNSSGDPIVVDSIDFWPYGQHEPSQLLNGNILMYDDGDFRGYYNNANVPFQSYSRGVEYKINESNRTIQLVWEYDNNKSIFTEFTGTIQQFPTTNTRLIGYMSTTTKGVTPQIVEIDSQNNTVFQVVVNQGQNYYRAVKINLYDGIK